MRERCCPSSEKKRTVPSLLAETTSPAETKATRLAGWWPWPRISFICGRVCWASTGDQRRSVPSSPLETSDAPSGLKSTEVTAPSWPSSRTPRCQPSALQSCTDPSPAAVASIAPSVENCASRTRTSLSSLTCSPDATFQARSWRSSPADTSVCPSGEKVSAATLPSCASSDCFCCARASSSLMA